jgi:hypothetical protein
VGPRDGVAIGVEIGERLEESWRLRAPPRLVAEFDAG